MRSFADIERTFSGQPPGLSARLARIDVARGGERRLEERTPELLRQLAEDARVASITASNAIEGVTVSEERRQSIAEGSRRFRNRNEREFAGYRDATDAIVREPYEAPTVPFLLRLHRTIFHHSGGRGGNLKSDRNLIVSYEGGSRHVVFEPPPPEETEFLLTDLLARYDTAQREELTHPLILIAALILDLLSIHPVADGNGRLARLLTTHELLGNGYGAPRFVSVEQRIFESKNSYYASLYESQRGWHTAEHTIWPWVAYLVEILAGAYEDLESRLAAAPPTTGSKQGRVRDHVLSEAPPEFRRKDIERALPDISQATIRLVLETLRKDGLIEATGSGRGARWHRK